MARFCELGLEQECIVGKGIELSELFGRRILIEKVRIDKTKYPGKNSSGMRMQMQVVLAEFHDTPDADGDYYVKSMDGTPAGERRSCFTGSDILMETMQRAMDSLPGINHSRAEMGLPPLTLFPMDTTIVKMGKCFQFT